ncbi:MAG: transcriptional regulator [Methanobacteriota archaeon]|jgi:DNA-binding Lrp family transcriptional regulator|nr:MAG: transcriptional regulator [Euryarchaeota archaeon]HIG19856.1 Lrp/AsnC family transcriptional regulator [Candidatus Poseidoniales archaeon]
MLFSQLDDKDTQILELLIEDARASTKSIADRLNIPRVTVHDRIKRLQERGVIDKFTVKISHEKLGLPLHGFLLANWAGNKAREDRRSVAKEICKLPFIVGCHIITGQWDFIIEVVAREMDSLGDSILDELSKIEGIGHTQTMVTFYSYSGAASGA